MLCHHPCSRWPRKYIYHAAALTSLSLMAWHANCCNVQLNVGVRVLQTPFKGGNIADLMTDKEIGELHGHLPEMNSVFTVVGNQAEVCHPPPLPPFQPASHPSIPSTNGILTLCNSWERSA